MASGIWRAMARVGWNSSMYTFFKAGLNTMIQRVLFRVEFITTKHSKEIKPTNQNTLRITKLNETLKQINWWTDSRRKKNHKIDKIKTRKVVGVNPSTSITCSFVLYLVYLLRLTEMGCLGITRLGNPNSASPSRQTRCVYSRCSSICQSISTLDCILVIRRENFINIFWFFFKVLSW